MFKNKQKISDSRHNPTIPGVKDKLSISYLYIPTWRLPEPNVSLFVQPLISEITDLHTYSIKNVFQGLICFFVYQSYQTM